VLAVASPHLSAIGKKLYLSCKGRAWMGMGMG